MVLATQPDKAAFKAGLEAGDKIIKIDDYLLGVGDQAVTALVKRIQSSYDEQLTIEVERNGSYKDLRLIQEKLMAKGQLVLSCSQISKETKKLKV